MVTYAHHYSTTLCSHFRLATVLPFLECLMVGMIHYVAISDWLLSFSSVHNGSSMLCQGLKADGSLSPVSHLLSGPPSIHLPIEESATGNKHLCSGFCVDIVSTHLNKHQEVLSPDKVVRVCFVS